MRMVVGRDVHCKFLSWTFKTRTTYKDTSHLSASEIGCFSAFFQRIYLSSPVLNISVYQRTKYFSQGEAKME